MSRLLSARVLMGFAAASVLMTAGCGDDGGRPDDAGVDALPGVDGQVILVDAMTPSPDASVPVADAQVPTADAMTSADASPVDAALPTPDATPPTPDATPPAPDAMVDAAPPSPDAQVDDPPTITPIGNTTTDEDIATGAIGFTIGDPDTALGSLVVSATSSNQTILPDANITLGGSGANRTINVIGANNQNGVVTITVTVQDLTSSVQELFDVTITPVNDPPSATNDSFLGASGTTGNVQLVVTGSVLTNDSDVDGPSLTATAVSGTGNTSQGGDVTIATDGTFTYTPAPGYLGNDTFTYTLNDNDPTDPRTDTGTVTIQVAAPMTWFVDNTAAVGGDGRNSSPFRQLISVETAPVTGTGDTILVAPGDGTTANQNQGIVLKNNQRLIGQSGAVTPRITNGSSGPTIIVADGNTVDNFVIDAPLAGGISGSSVDSGAFSGITISNASGDGINLTGTTGTFTFTSLDITNSNGAGLHLSNAGTVNITGGGNRITTTTGRAVDISGTTLDISFDSVSSDGGDHGIDITSTSGSFTVTGDGTGNENGSGGTIQNTSGTGINLDGSQGISLTSMNVNNTGGDGVRADVVAGLTLEGVGVSLAGDSSGEHGINITSPTDTVTIDNSTVSDFSDSGIVVSTAFDVDTAVNITSTTVTKASMAFGTDGIVLLTSNLGRLNPVTIDGVAVTDVQGRGISAVGSEVSLLNLTVKNSSFSNSMVAIDIAQRDAGLVLFDLDNNIPIELQGAAGINVRSAVSSVGGSLEGIIQNNSVGSPIAPGVAKGDGIHLNLAGEAKGIVEIAGNGVMNVPFGRGIFAGAEQGGGGLDVVVHDNQVFLDASAFLAAFRVTSNDDNPVCALFRDNTATAGQFDPGPPPFGGAYVVGEGDISPGTMLLEGFTGDFIMTMNLFNNMGDPKLGFGQINAPAAPCLTPFAP